MIVKRGGWEEQVRWSKYVVRSSWLPATPGDRKARGGQFPVTPWLSRCFLDCPVYQFEILRSLGAP